jgi:uncharacterized membrane protein
LEEKEIVSNETAIRIRSYIRSEESATYWKLFLVLGGIMGALFASAGVFSLIAHNWDEYPKHLRGFFSIVPVATGLYFYYRALFHHSNSKTWIEASSMFLMLMIGASIALVSQTYQMDGDFDLFVKVWMLLTIPLFYLGRSSGITLFYLGLSLLLTFDIGLGAWGIPYLNTGDDELWYWFLVLAFLPHYYMSLNRNGNKQSIRVVYLSYCLYFTTMAALMITIKSNYLLWFATAQLGFYLLGMRLMSGNSWAISRPFQLLSQIGIGWLLIALSNEQALYYGLRFDSIFNYEYWDGEQIFYFVFLVVVMAGIYYNYYRSKKPMEGLNKFVVYTPFFILFIMLVDEYTISWWWLTIPLNAFAIAFGVSAMIQGSSNGKVYKVAAGLIFLSILLWTRYFDTSLGFISKGLLFIVIGGFFFMINMLVKEKVDTIERQKNWLNEK